MNLLLAFSPFLAFAVLEHFAGIAIGLVAAALLSAALVLRDLLKPGRQLKLLEVGSLLLFGGLAGYALALGVSWSVLGVRLFVDIGLCTIVALSLLLGRPFTLPYAKEQAPAEVWDSPRFLRLNQVLTGVWLLAFGVIVAADALMLFMPGVPLGAGIAITVAALAGAFKFSETYAERVAARARHPG